MSKFSIFFISLITLVHNLLNEYTINLVNLNLSSNYIIPVISPNKDLYIVTGLSENNDQNKYPRQILNYSSYSGALVQEYFYESNYSFEGPEIICAGDNFEYLLTYTINSIELFEWKNYKLIEQMKYLILKEEQYLDIKVHLIINIVMLIYIKIIFIITLI